MLKHIVEPITGIDFLVHVGSPITWGVYERVGERGGGGVLITEFFVVLLIFRDRFRIISCLQDQTWVQAGRN